MKMGLKLLTAALVGLGALCAPVHATPQGTDVYSHGNTFKSFVTAGSSMTASAFFGDGSHLSGVLAIGNTITGGAGLTVTYGTITSTLTVSGTSTMAAATFSGAVTLSAQALLYSRTVAQLAALAPGAAGGVAYCSNCSPPKVVVGTGTAAGNWADAVGATFK